MAARGLDEDLKRKRMATYDKGLEKDCRNWIEAVTGERLGADFTEAIKDGQVLCRLVNVIAPGSVAKIYSGTMPFKLMQNIQAFTDTIAAWGVPSASSFQTVDLWEAKNMNQVILTIQATSRKAAERGYRGPSIDIARPTLAD
eukprot:c52144_g1_i1.p2 GENE.c52144_g1_i1~~c52144_g1_i1.p2  ORF type:complete len:151 (-),score=28.65 c52144_g1_i1:35-463(-)